MPLTEQAAGLTLKGEISVMWVSRVMPLWVRCSLSLTLESAFWVGEGPLLFSSLFHLVLLGVSPRVQDCVW